MVLLAVLTLINVVWCVYTTFFADNLIGSSLTRFVVFSVVLLVVDLVYLIHWVADEAWKK